MPSLEFSETPSHLSRFDLSAPAKPPGKQSASAPASKPKVVEIGSSRSPAKTKPKIVEVSEEPASSSSAPAPKVVEVSEGAASSTTHPNIIEVDDEPSPPTKTRITIIEVDEDGEFDLTGEEPPPLDDDAPPLDDDVPPLDDDAPPAPASKATPPPPPEDEGPSLMEQMMADANVARDKKLEAKKTEEKRMKKQFGDGLKGNLKKGFLSSKKEKPAKKAPPEKARAEKPPEVIETIRPQTRGKPKPGERQSAIKDEVAQAMAAESHPMTQALQGGQWITPDLTQKIGSNPRLAMAMADPRFDAALKTMAKDPKRAMAMLEAEPFLKEAFLELCGQMGGHFSALGEKEQQSTPAPEAVPEAEMGPMAQDAMRRHREGNLPAPSSNKEQHEIDAVLQDDELKAILMDPAMQTLLRECSDPSALHKAMRDPKIRAKFEKLAEAGLIRIER